MSERRANYSREVEREINDLITFCWSVSRTYTFLSCLCVQETRLSGFRDFFEFFSLRSRCMLERLVRFQSVRGGQLEVGEVKRIIGIPRNMTASMYKFLSIALDMEKRIEQWVRKLHDLATTKSDVLTTEFVEKHFVREQTPVIKWIVNHLEVLQSCPNQWLYDRLLMHDLTEQITASLHSFKVTCFAEAMLTSKLGDTSRNEIASNLELQNMFQAN